MATKKVENSKVGPFDRAFGDAVEFLDDHKHQHNKFANKEDLLKQLGLNPKAYYPIRRLETGVPRHRVLPIMSILISEYGFRRDFLERYELPMFPKGVHHWLEAEEAYETAQDKIKRLEEEIAKLKSEKAALELRLKAKKPSKKSFE